jgi:hypothetical protein
MQNLSLNDISQFARLVGHLKNDILLPQLLEQTDPSVLPKVLSLLVLHKDCVEVSVMMAARWLAC